MHNSGGRARQIYECEASLIYRASSRTTWVTWRNPVIKNKKKKERKKEIKKERKKKGRKEGRQEGRKEGRKISCKGKI